jgi:hypothetical protein
LGSHWYHAFSRWSSFCSSCIFVVVVSFSQRSTKSHIPVPLNEQMLIECSCWFFARISSINTNGGTPLLSSLFIHAIRIIYSISYLFHRTD